MNNLNIVLLEPQIPQNTGNIARTCSVVSCPLHIIHPIGFKINDKTVKRAGLDYWDTLEIYQYDNITDFFNKNTGNYYFVSTKAQKIYSEIKYCGNVYLIFGREDKGLPEKLLCENKNFCIRIPMKNHARSLNLSNSVSITAYEVLKQWDFSGLQLSGTFPNP